MPAKFCLGCGQLTSGGSRCPACAAARQAQNNSRPKANTSARGLGGTHRRRAEKIVAEAAVCARCGAAPTKDNPLTAHHTTARAKGGIDSALVALCRRCNSSIGDRTDAEPP